MDRSNVWPRHSAVGIHAIPLFRGRSFAKRFRIAAILSLTAVLIASVRADEIRSLDGRAVIGEVQMKRGGVRIADGELFLLTQLLDVRWSKPTLLPMASGVVLVDGSRVAGQIRGIADHGVTVQPAEGDSLLIPLDRVARAQFVAVDDDRFKACADGTTAAVLKNGDVFAGTLQSFDGKNLTMDSPEFGSTTFVTVEKAVAVNFHNTTPFTGGVRVTVADGTLFAAEKIEPDAINGDTVEKLKITARGIGVLTVPVDQLVEIARSGPGVVDAAILRPTAIDGGPADRVYAIDRATDGLSTRIIGPPPGRVICVSNGSVTMAVPDGCDFLAARLAVPADVVPSTGVKMSVLVDGAVQTTVTRTSVDDPAAVMVPVAGHRTISLKVESAATGPSSGVVGLWCDPVFLKHVERPKPATKPATRPATTGPTTRGRVG